MTIICKIIFWGAVGWTICYLAIGSIAAAIRSAQLSRRLRRKKPKSKGEDIEIAFRLGDGTDWQHCVDVNKPDSGAQVVLDNDEDWLPDAGDAIEYVGDTIHISPATDNQIYLRGVSKFVPSNDSIVQPVKTADSVFAPDDLYALDSEPIETEDPPVEGDSEATEQAVDRVLKTLDRPPVRLSPEELQEIERDSL